MVRSAAAAGPCQANMMKWMNTCLPLVRSGRGTQPRVRACKYHLRRPRTGRKNVSFCDRAQTTGMRSASCRGLSRNCRRQGSRTFEMGTNANAPPLPRMGHLQRKRGFYRRSGPAEIRHDAPFSSPVRRIFCRIRPSPTAPGCLAGFATPEHKAVRSAPRATDPCCQTFCLSWTT
jgi:hypothetical protein